MAPGLRPVNERTGQVGHIAHTLTWSEGHQTRISSGRLGPETCSSHGLPSPTLLPWRRPGHGRVAGSKTCVLSNGVLTHVLTQVPLSEQCLYFVPFFVEKGWLYVSRTKSARTPSAGRGVWPGFVAPHNINWCLELVVGGDGPHYLGLKCSRPEGCLLGHGGRTGSDVQWADPPCPSHLPSTPLPPLSASAVFAWLGAEGHPLGGCAGRRTWPQNLSEKGNGAVTAPCGRPVASRPCCSHG